MTPEVRAIADRFIYEQATVKLIVNLAPEGALGRPVPGNAWTVRQLLGHLAQSLNDYAEMIRSWLEGVPPVPKGWSPDEVNAATAKRFSNADREEILAHFGIGLNSLVAALAAIPDDRVADQFGSASLQQTLEVLSGHCLEHAIPLLDAMPEVRMDPLVLNWLLEAKFQADADRQWQAELLREAREYVANHPGDEEDE